MADDITQPDGQEPEGTQEPQAGIENHDSHDAGTTDPADLARLRKELKDTRKEAAQNRVKLKQYEDERMSEQQRVEQQRNEAAARADQLETTVRDLQAQVAAAKFGVRPEAIHDVARLIDWDQVDDSSDSKQVERAVRDVIKERPYLSGRPGGLDAGARSGGGVATKPSIGSLLRRESGYEPN